MRAVIERYHRICDGLIFESNEKILKRDIYITNITNLKDKAIIELFKAWRELSEARQSVNDSAQRIATLQTDINNLRQIYNRDVACLEHTVDVTERDAEEEKAELDEQIESLRRSIDKLMNLNPIPFPEPWA